MGKGRSNKDKKVERGPAPPAEEDKCADNVPEDGTKKADEGVTAQYIGSRIVFYVAGGNPILIHWINTYLLDHRFGLMCLGLAMGSLFSEWLNTVIAPVQR
jgi:hypothetical protein